MKEISKNLPEHERKAYAEKVKIPSVLSQHFLLFCLQVAIAFYKSIGGESEDEE